VVLPMLRIPFNWTLRKSAPAKAGFCSMAWLRSASICLGTRIRLRGQSPKAGATFAPKWKRQNGWKRNGRRPEVQRLMAPEDLPKING